MLFHFCPTARRVTYTRKFILIITEKYFDW
jgi:hypothetical protein